MTHIRAEEGINRRGQYHFRLKASGHADFDEHGKDIVCAAISVLCISLANTLRYYQADDKPDITIDDGDVYIEAVIDHGHADVNLMGAFRMACLGLQMIADQYPDHVSFKLKQSGVLL